MDLTDFTFFVNLLGFALGFALFSMLLAMVLLKGSKGKSTAKVDYLLAATAILGLLWNLGEIIIWLKRDFGSTDAFPLISAISFSALGFLPAVVVHSTLENREKFLGRIKFSGYILGFSAAIFHFYHAFSGLSVPSGTGLQILTFGYLAILGILFLSHYKKTLKREALWAGSLAVFAVSALHLTNHNDSNPDHFLLEFIGHQSSLILVSAILYEHYRFAFADIFLKRALALITLITVCCILYFFAVSPLLSLHESHEKIDATAIATIIAFAVVMALLFSTIQEFSVWFVDKVILRRANYEELQTEIAKEIEKFEDQGKVLNYVAEELGHSLTAKTFGWEKSDDSDDSAKKAYFPSFDLQRFDIPTTEQPFYSIVLSDFEGGRRLLSDERTMLEGVCNLTARRLDVLRVSHQRCEQEIREQEFEKLATEAELKALRAQLNPHFLFNALTTIGYLIQKSPENALQTLMQLTRLLRGVLRTTNEFSTLGEEMNLIEAYLEIEKARFEERLSIAINVSPDLLKLKIPALLLQPLVENAIKHGISNSKKGGEVVINAKIEGEGLILKVEDTGAGADIFDILANKENQIGLRNIEARLDSYFGKSARIHIESEIGKGTSVEMFLPLSLKK